MRFESKWNEEKLDFKSFQWRAFNESSIEIKLYNDTRRHRGAEVSIGVEKHDKFKRDNFFIGDIFILATFAPPFPDLRYFLLRNF